MLAADDKDSGHAWDAWDTFQNFGTQEYSSLAWESFWPAPLSEVDLLPLELLQGTEFLDYLDYLDYPTEPPESPCILCVGSPRQEQEVVVATVDSSQETPPPAKRSRDMGHSASLGV